MNPKVMSRIVAASSTAGLIAGPVIVLLLVGLWLDSVFHTSPFLGLLLGLGGFVSGLVSLIKLLKTLK